MESRMRKDAHAAFGDTVSCAYCDLPTKPLKQGDRNRTSQAFCCSGCCLAFHLSASGVANSADKMLSRVLLSAMLSMAVMMLSLSMYGALFGDESDFDGETAAAFQGLLRLAAMFVSAPVLVLLGLPLAETVLRMKRWLSADALIVMGTGAAWIVSSWNTLFTEGEVYFDTATMVLVLVSLGRWLDLRAKERAREALQVLLPDREGAVCILNDGQEGQRRAEDLRVGDLLRLRPGDVVPVDGRVIQGSSFVDASSLTGESEPRSVVVGDPVLAGSSLVDGQLDVMSTAVGAERVCEEVERLLLEALRAPAPSVQVADRVAGALIPMVFVLAAGTALWHWPRSGPEAALLAALSVVLIACPCSLGIATPLAFWNALGEAWKHGVLVRGGAVLEQLAGARRMWLDKTGTLTDGEFELTDIQTCAELNAEQALEYAANLELYSEHPIGRSLRRAHRVMAPFPPCAPIPISEFRVLPGVGVQARMEGALWSLRKAGLEGGIHLLREGVLQAEFSLQAQQRPEAAAVIAELRAMGLDLFILTGDGTGPAQRIADELGLEVKANLMPADKVAWIKRESPEDSIFVGDGLNDAAALASAAVGITVAGSAARSMDAAPVNLLRPGLGSLPGLLRLARRARSVARWNLAWAFGYNAVGLVLAVGGHLPPVLAAAAMVASSVTVVLHSSRLKAGTEWGETAP
ncbi:MAG: heavy metal translocating P-type ATPase [Candidatus Paceibacteria bacterium]|jgi:heavy metal translocating P-type ATPase